MLKKFSYHLFLKPIKKNKILAAMKVAHPYEEVAYQIYSLENDNQYEGLGQYGELKEETDAVTFFELCKRKVWTRCNTPFQNSE